jgi:DNA polymerase III subunit delta
MKANSGQIERALDAPSDAVRLYFLYGADEATSHAQAARLAAALGAGAERVDLSGAVLKEDRARLADEAASISLFGDKRYIRLTNFGEESLAAITTLLEAPAAGNPVVAIGGAFKGTSVLLKLVLASPAAMVCANYPLDDEKAGTLALAMARAEGIRLQPEAARALAAAAANDRAVMAREVEKLALYLDAAPDRPCEAGMLALEAIGAGEGEGELSRMVDAVLDGKPGELAGELAMLAESGMEGIPLIRAVSRRVQLLAGMAGKIADGAPAAQVVETGTKALFWKDQAPAKRQSRRWSAQRLATAADRLLAAERAIKSAGSVGALVGDADLIAISRAGQRTR